MSLKAVELQIAIPRTQEVGRIQDQHLQRSMHEQQAMIADRKSQDEAMRQRPAEVNEPSPLEVRDKQEKPKKRRRSEAGSRSQAANKTAGGETGQPVDPVRGRHIDITL
ncbi:hypothetical protein ACI7RC_01930 [Brevibacillus sp. B_LB10_24]|uniref:hypothetical protein n=1 Tax=Brevibacillus sp. B_LB10_24 TaxID=3380645 RepID=UPI0038BB8E60